MRGPFGAPRRAALIFRPRRVIERCDAQFYTLPLLAPANHATFVAFRRTTTPRRVLGAEREKLSHLLSRIIGTEHAGEGLAEGAEM